MGRRPAGERSGGWRAVGWAGDERHPSDPGDQPPRDRRRRDRAEAARPQRRRPPGRAERAAARRRRPRGPAPARGRRRRVGQDQGPHPAHRLDRLPAQGTPRLDPRDHLHQQGGGRDEGAGRGAGRPPRAVDVGQHLPLRLRAHPAQGDRQARLQVQLHDLRRRRLQAADDDGDQRPRPRPASLPGRRRPALGLVPQERAARPRGGRRRRPQQVRGGVRRGVHPLPAAPPRLPTRSTSTTS